MSTVLFSGIKKMKKLPIDYLGAFGATVGELYFPQTKLLLPFDGSNGATTTSDLSNSNHAVTFAGTAQISTAQSKFGSSSLLLDGNSDYITVTNSDLSVGGATFTLEFWTYLLGGIGSLTSFYSDYSSASNGFYIQKQTSNVIQVGFTGDGADILGTTALTTGQWYHIAISGSGGSYKLFLDGTQEGSTFTGSATSGSSTKYIGNFYHSSTGNIRFTNGYIEDFRITKNVARYTSNFTPPTTAYLTSAGDVNKQIIINSAADGVAIGTGGINQARIAKAWCNFNGTGTVAIRDSYNVSSLTDNGTGDYTVTYSTAMPSADYCVLGSNTGSNGSYSNVISGFGSGGNSALTTTYVRCMTGYSYSAYAWYDFNFNHIAIFGN
jgi:hypothetical protein